MNMKLPITGGCACGAIRYEITAEPSFNVEMPLPRLPAYHWEWIRSGILGSG
jgi:hypothetical protein